MSPSRPSRLWAVTLVVALLAACSGGNEATGGIQADPTQPVPDAVLERSGGDGTVHLATRDAFAQPVPGLDSAQRRTFAVGNSFFNQNWVTAPASTEGRDGLGPIFNAQSCSSCHFKDGRGQPPLDREDPERGLLIRLSVVDDSGAPMPHPTLGGQFQDRSILDVDPEGSVLITTTEKTGTYDDGVSYTLADPTYTLVDADGSPIDDPELLISPRVAPVMIGVGLLEAIPEDDVRAAADPEDEDGDGISGRVNSAVDPRTGREVLGRFGWKASVASVEAQVSDAFAGDLGITTPLNPDEPCTEAQSDCRAAPSGGEPEVEQPKLDQVTFYSRTLAVPARRSVADRVVRSGEQAFGDIGCSACHTPEQRTGADALPSLAHQDVRPYTDLLLHDMGAGLADGRPDRDADGQEWRTPPLWGIGLVQTVNGHTRFLHDGRARNLEEAILWHGGEGSAAQERFRSLDASDREALIAFLESL